MNYKVLIPNKIKREIAKLPSDLRYQVLQRVLGELPSDPNGLLGEVVIPYSVRAYSFNIKDSQGNPHWFVFHIDGLDPAAHPELHVVGFRHMDFDPLADLGPAP